MLQSHWEDLVALKVARREPKNFHPHADQRLRVMRCWLGGANVSNLQPTNFYSSQEEAEEAKNLLLVYRNVSPSETEEANLPSEGYNFQAVFVFALVRQAYSSFFIF